MLSVRDSRDETPLHWAVNQSRFTTLEHINLLISSGANINSKNIRGYTPLSKSLNADNNSQEVFQLLLNNGADVDVYYDHLGLYSGEVPIIHEVITRGLLNLLNLLIQKGANIEIQSISKPHTGILPVSSGLTPLHHAVYLSNFGDTPNIKYSSIIKVLIENGANINAVAEDGRTPLDMVLQTQFSTTVVDILTANGAKSGILIEPNIKIVQEGWNRFNFSTSKGSSYTILESINFDQWSILHHTVGDGDIFHFIDPSSEKLKYKFYKVIQQN